MCVIELNFFESLVGNSFWLRNHFATECARLGRGNVVRFAGVDFSNTSELHTLLRPGTGALRQQTFQTGS